MESVTKGIRSVSKMIDGSSLLAHRLTQRPLAHLLAEKGLKSDHLKNEVMMKFEDALC